MPKTTKQANLSALVKSFPHNPGVYKMKNKAGEVLYIGKAKDLKNRIKTYFQQGYAHSTRTRKLIENTADIEYIVTDSELEAYVLETNLIKELRPRYNILMKDDKNFVYIKIQLNEDFPRIRVVRKIEKDGAKYIGPKTGVTKVFEFFRMLKKLFPFRHCQLDIQTDRREVFLPKNRTAEDNTTLQPINGLPGIDYLGESHPERVKVTNQVIDFPCLDYYIKRCPGPCIGASTKEEYRKIIDQIIDFLEGRGEELLKKLKTHMIEAASKKQFELAARLRDKLVAVEGIMEKQKMSDPERKDADVIHFHIEFGKVYVNIFLVRDGKLIRHENFILDVFDMDKALDVTSSEILESFLHAYYEKAADIPKEILIPESIENKELIEKWISGMKGEKVKILIPQKGEKNKLLELSRKNAETFAKQYRIKFMAAEAEKQAASDLAEVLEIKDRTLKRIECYDISHLSGEHTVGSMVVFENGYPKREHYRHFKLRTVQGKPDDFASMKEVFLRRLKYLATNIDENVILKTPVKKELLEMTKTLEEQYRSTEGMERKNCVVAKRNDRIIGFGRLHKLNEKITEISGLWVVPEERGKHLGYEIIHRLIERSKQKRIYIDTVKNLESYFAVFGFNTLKIAPEALVEKIRKIMELLEREKQPIPEAWVKGEIIYMVYDKTTHTLDPSFTAKPQLIVVDGGKPQLSAALQALKQFNLDIPVCALAKRLEEIYLPGKQAPILLEEGEEALKLLQRLRDEAHRFAIEFQRNLKRKQLVTLK